MKHTFVEHYKCLKRIHQFIRQNGTGSPNNFSSRLGISVATMYRYLDELRNLGAEIGYCSVRESYYYQTEFTF